jgi:hypothetical protein
VLAVAPPRVAKKQLRSIWDPLHPRGINWAFLQDIQNGQHYDDSENEYSDIVTTVPFLIRLYSISTYCNPYLNQSPMLSLIPRDQLEFLPEVYEVLQEIKRNQDRRLPKPAPGKRNVTELDDRPQTSDLDDTISSSSAVHAKKLKK